MVSGRDVLYALRDIEGEIPSGYSVHARLIAHRLGLKDSRSITHKLDRLQNVNLIERVAPAIWKTTERGREVEALLSAADTRRGGEFRPYRDFLPDLRERIALSL